MESPEKLYAENDWEFACTFAFKEKGSLGTTEYIRKDIADKEKEELRNYADHKGDCRSHYLVNWLDGKTDKCTCGLNELLK